MSLINKCLQTGYLPVNLKLATFTPLLKKPSLDVLKKIGQCLSCFSFHKFWRKMCWINFIVFCQVIEFKRFFNLVLSLLTALLRVLNNIYLSTDSGDSVVLLLSDLSAAFDTIDQCFSIPVLGTPCSSVQLMAPLFNTADWDHQLGRWESH